LKTKNFQNKFSIIPAAKNALGLNQEQFDFFLGNSYNLTKPKRRFQFCLHRTFPYPRVEDRNYPLLIFLLQNKIKYKIEERFIPPWQYDSKVIVFSFSLLFTKRKKSNRFLPRILFSSKKFVKFFSSMSSILIKSRLR